jgi:hypothetical protein
MLLRIAPRFAWKIRGAIAETFAAEALGQIREAERLIEFCPVPGSYSLAFAETRLAYADVLLSLARTFLGMEEDT